MGRKYGIHILLATQSPRAEVFAGALKDNINIQIAFRATTAAHAAVLGQYKARTIKANQKGMAIFDGAFIQTPLKDNQKWWSEEEVVEDFPFSSQEEEKAKLLSPDQKKKEGTSSLTQEEKRPKFLPGHKGDEGAEFMAKDELSRLLGDDPKHFGFLLKKRRIKEKLKRGYYVIRRKK